MEATEQSNEQQRERLSSADVTFGPQVETERGEEGDTPPLSPLSAAPIPGGAGGDDVYTPPPRVNPVVKELARVGLYGSRLGEGHHSVVCPWSAEHSGAETARTFYAEPDATHPIGRFQCSHPHPEHRDAHGLIKHLGISAAVARAKPKIRVIPGDSHRAVTAAERVLAEEGRYFHAGGSVVRLTFKAGRGASVELVTDQTLSSVLASLSGWEKLRGKDWVRCDPPHEIVRGLRSGQDRTHLPALAGIARQPYFRQDGSLVTAAGYDPASSMYADFKPHDYVFGDMTRDRTEHSLELLNWILREFHFKSTADKSAALCAILTAAVRPSLSQAPAFNITARRPGTGKSYLAKIISKVASPGEPYNVSYPRTSEEAAKSMLAILLEMPAVILFDDMDDDWKSFTAINRVLTSPTTSERVLGQSRTATARTNCLIVGTGNNIYPDRDMRRRVVSIDLDPRSETPSLLEYQGDPLSFVRENRSRVVKAALTIIAAFREAGQPLSKVPPIATYEEWSLSCRQPLMWLGEPDPATSLIDQVTHDPDQGQLAEFLDEWFDRFGTADMMVREVSEAARQTPELMAVLEDISVSDRGGINGHKLGQYLKRNCGRIADGLQIQRGHNPARNAWRVTPVDPAAVRPPRERRQGAPALRQLNDVY